MGHAAFYSEPMILRFDSYENRVAKGKLQTICYRTPFQFDSMDHLFMIMDDVLDSIRFPRREGALRHLGMNHEERTFILEKDVQEECVEKEAEKEGESGWKSADMSGFHGQATVVVNRREHSSMQGTLVLDGERANFRSALELMHMFHEYLEKRF